MFFQFNRFMMAIAFTALAAAQTTTTTTTQTLTSNTPPVGLASSETAQINLVNTASNAADGTAASCAGTVTFLNSSGAAIGAATPFTVASGVIQSISLPFGKSGATGTRTEIRASISQTITAECALWACPNSAGTLTVGDGVPCNLQVTLETYDTSTGVTHVFLANGSGNVGEVGVGSLPAARVQSH
jgi:hypothetical protein